MVKQLKKHYHWVMAVVLFLMMAIRGGVQNNLSSLHLIPVTEALEISRAQFSLAGSASSIVAMLMTIASGVLIARYGYRMMVSVFLLVASGAYMLMAKAESYPLLFLGYVLLGMSNGMCGEASVTRTVSVWFHKHRGVVLGVVTSATGFGGCVLSILQTETIERSSYRASFLMSAGLLLVCAVMTVLLVRSHPAKMGLLPYGDGERIEYKKREHEQDHWHGMTMQQIVRRPTFYIMLFGTLLSCVCTHVLYLVLSPHLQDRGLTAIEAGRLQGVLMLALAGAKILTGYLCDGIGARKVTLLCMGINVASLILMTRLQGTAMATVAVILHALALPLTTVTVPMLALSLFGYRAQDKYTGLFIAMVSASSIVASPIANTVYDKIGTYNPVFLIASGVTVLLMGAYLLMYRWADKDRKRLEQAETAPQ